MTILDIPAYGLADARYHLLAETGQPESLLEHAADELLTLLRSAVEPGRPALTKASVVELVDQALRTAREKTGAESTCPCGHPADDHVGWLGCFECDCTERRRHAAETAPAVTR